MRKLFCEFKDAHRPFKNKFKCFYHDHKKISYICSVKVCFFYKICVNVLNVFFKFVFVIQNIFNTFCSLYWKLHFFRCSVSYRKFSVCVSLWVLQVFNIIADCTTTVHNLFNTLEWLNRNQIHHWCAHTSGKTAY